MKYEVSIKNAKGTCENSLFSKMAKNGDIQAKKVTEVIGEVVTIKGYAVCNIQTEDKNFDITYFDTKELGLISSGSEIFANSVFEYYGEVEKVRIVEVKTRKGKTYKAQPILEEKESEKTEDDLPF